MGWGGVEVARGRGSEPGVEVVGKCGEVRWRK